MAKYRITARRVEWMDIEVEAESEDEAKTKVSEADDGWEVFDSRWEIDDAEEVG